MSGRKKNSLVVIENRQIVTYDLDDKLVWEVGRPSKGNNPDIKLYSMTVSRKHGRFQNTDGMWFYLDENGKNGTVYNGKHVVPGIHGRVKPIWLKDKDILIFGGGEEPTINSKTIWTMFMDLARPSDWRVEDTEGLSRISFTGSRQKLDFDSVYKGLVVETEDGMAIYMGDVTYVSGDMEVVGY